MAADYCRVRISIGVNILLEDNTTRSFIQLGGSVKGHFKEAGLLTSKCPPSLIIVIIIKEIVKASLGDI